MSDQSLSSAKGLHRSGRHALDKLALFVNVIVVAVLAWHVAFEVLPGIARQFAAHRHLTMIESVAVLARLLPYLLLSGYLAWRRSVMFRWSTLAIALLAVALYVGIVFGTTLYLHRGFVPA
jgi:hypothetical protein